MNIGAYPDEDQYRSAFLSGAGRNWYQVYFRANTAPIASMNHIAELRYQWPTRYIGNRYNPVIASMASKTFMIVRDMLSDPADNSFSKAIERCFLPTCLMNFSLILARS